MTGCKLSNICFYFPTCLYKNDSLETEVVYRAKHKIFAHKGYMAGFLYTEKIVHFTEKCILYAS